ncbi:unnamed protein product [Didymodactylos carnosus]|uniref:Uncharacterized protein n=1 Tax=Didymodactylos carnosus TaxID=1234261 RepID=A0A8S2EAR4_9BILA|nr:unnamed protein product [Didymodactylos carnosus]CAF3984711.1 unnamed protein product [Didymodactylos carnosus]
MHHGTYSPANRIIERRNNRKIPPAIAYTFSLSPEKESSADELSQETPMNEKPQYDANLTHEGRIDLHINENTCKNFHGLPSTEFQPQDETLIYGEGLDSTDNLTLGQEIPRLAICIMIVGSQGDVQPFVAFGKELMKAGHRVRLATHETFRKFVRENGLEFYPLRGDPKELMEYAVKNEGIIPSFGSILEGDVSRTKEQLVEILDSTFKACIEPDDETNHPFIAEAIISNPPTFGHIHCAQKLCIPLHICFTMPWSPTGAFPHPLANISYNKEHISKINYLSYEIVEVITWSGMKHLINDFRKKTLELETLSTSQAIHLMTTKQVPHTYCWSPALLGKPKDWKEYTFQPIRTFSPPDDLVQFLKSDSPVIYIGFGSIVPDNSARLTKAVLEAVKLVNCKAVISKGWGRMGDGIEVSEKIYLLDQCPHDWLFPQVTAVCHHGGAGTTAAGLRYGKPTIIVPFFGDQFFWGSVVHIINAGPLPLPGKNLTAYQLADAIRFSLKHETCTAAEEIASKMKRENGVAAAVRSFHVNLPLERMLSDLETTFPACFSLPKYDMKISRPVAQVLVASAVIEETDLEFYPVKQWEINEDSHAHVPTYGLVKGAKKAVSTLTSETADGFETAWNASNPLSGTVAIGKGLLKGVGGGLFHSSKGILSLYGETSHLVNKVPSLYDCNYTPQRPVVSDMSTGVKAAKKLVQNSFKEGATDWYKKPKEEAKRHGKKGYVIGAGIGLLNVPIKPMVGTLEAISLASHGAYLSAKHHVKGKDTKENFVSLRLSRSHNASNENILAEHNNDESAASAQSGYSREVCQQILDEFQSNKTVKKDIYTMIKKLRSRSLGSLHEKNTEMITML